MALKYIFSNNAKSELAVAMGSSDTTLQITSGDGSLFSDPTSGTECALIQVVQGSQSAYMVCTSRSSDVLTVTRTDSYSFTAGTSPATVKEVINADVLATFLQKGTERESDGDPTGTLTAAHLGEEVLDTTNDVWYKDCDGTWKEMNGGS